MDIFGISGGLVLLSLFSYMVFRFLMTTFDLGLPLL
jgi:hypothetical protein